MEMHIDTSMKEYMYTTIYINVHMAAPHYISPIGACLVSTCLVESVLFCRIYVLFCRIYVLWLSLWHWLAIVQAKYIIWLLEQEFDLHIRSQNFETQLVLQCTLSFRTDRLILDYMINYYFLYNFLTPKLYLTHYLSKS